MFNGIPGLNSLVPGARPPLAVTIKNVSSHWQMCPEGKIALEGEPLTEELSVRYTSPAPLHLIAPRWEYWPNMAKPERFQQKAEF